MNLASHPQYLERQDAMKFLSYRVLLAILEKLGGDTSEFPLMDDAPIGKAILDDIWELEFKEQDRRESEKGKVPEWPEWNL